MAKSSLLDSNSRFAMNPTRLKNVMRSRFDLSSTIKTSFNVGELIPFDVIEVLPGDTFDIETNILCRLQTLLTPIMDDLYLDVYYFFVPNRLVWDHWQEFCGENSASAWIPSTTYSVPVVRTGSSGVDHGSVLDYMGVPPKVGNLVVSALPTRAYGLIYNEWFRDQNLIDPALVDTNDVAVSYSKTNPARGGSPFLVSKYHDYFTSALPAPQKGPDVTIPMMSTTDFPVYTKEEVHDLGTSNDVGLKFGTQTGQGYTTGFHALYAYRADQNVNTRGELYSENRARSDLSSSNTQLITPVNLWSNIEGLPVATINQLRLAFATQRLYEKDARGGTRYTEILRSHFGVVSPDARLQRPELLSYNHVPIQIQQIVQNSETGTTPQGTTTAMSVTGNTDGSFVKSFTEHGLILGLCCARYNHTYQQGLNRMWSRFNRFDYYWPVFSNIGEQPILNKEIYAQGNSQDDEVFGYAEAWADYRFRPSRTSGEMRSTFDTPLDSWHLGDNYASLPHLSEEWIQEDKSIVDRVLAVTSEVADQLFMDIYIKNHATRPMPMYSIPGMSDVM